MPIPAKLRIIIAEVEGSGTAAVIVRNPGTLVVPPTPTSRSFKSNEMVPPPASVASPELVGYNEIRELGDAPCERRLLADCVEKLCC